MVPIERPCILQCSWGSNLISVTIFIQSEAYGSNTVILAVLDIFHVKKYDLDF